MVYFKVWEDTLKPEQLNGAFLFYTDTAEAVSSLCELVLHPLLVLHLVSEAVQLLLVRLPVALQLLLQRVLEEQTESHLSSILTG